MSAPILFSMALSFRQVTQMVRFLMYMARESISVILLLLLILILPSGDVSSGGMQLLMASGEGCSAGMQVLLLSPLYLRQTWHTWGVVLTAGEVYPPLSIAFLARILLRELHGALSIIPPEGIWFSPIVPSTGILLTLAGERWLTKEVAVPLLLSIASLQTIPRRLLIKTAPSISATPCWLTEWRVLLTTAGQ